MSTMMPSAASQQSTPLEGLMAALSRTLPPTDVQELLAAPRHADSQSRVERRNNMNTTVLVAARLYAGLRSTLALVGLAAVAALITLAVQREVVVRHLPALGAALTTL